jgi:hypothetical protein
MSMMRYVVNFRVDMALLAEGETIAFYKYDRPGGGRKDRSVRPQVPVLITSDLGLLNVNLIDFSSTRSVFS